MVKEKGGYQGLNDRYIDLRVDDHAEPVDELHRLLMIHLSYSALYQAGALREKGDMQGAVRQAERAVELNPTLPGAHYNLACFYSLAGMKDQALETLAHAIELSPEFKTLARDDPDFEPLRNEDAYKLLLEP